MKIKNLFVALATLMLGITTTYAQREDSPIVAQLNGNLQVGIPMGLFQENLDRVGFGGGGILTVRIPNTPIYGGLELSGMIYGSETQDYLINIGGFIKSYELRTTNNFFLGHFLIRVAPEIDFPIKPYVDGLIGTKNLYTRTRLTDQDDNDDDNTDSRIEQGDWAFSYGGAIGLQMDIFGNSGIVLDLRCAYLPGTNADYLVRRDGDSNTVYDDPIEAFEKRNSPTTLLLPQIGITFQFASSPDEEEEPRVPVR